MCGSGEPGIMSRITLLSEKCPVNKQEWPDAWSAACRIRLAGKLRNYEIAAMEEEGGGTQKAITLNLSCLLLSLFIFYS